MRKALESFLGSFGILIAGIWTIPLAGKLSGAHISMMSGLKMSILFFVARFIYLYLLRQLFSTREQVCK